MKSGSKNIVFLLCSLLLVIGATTTIFILQQNLIDEKAAADAAVAKAADGSAKEAAAFKQDNLLGHETIVTAAISKGMGYILAILMFGFLFSLFYLFFHMG